MIVIGKGRKIDYTKELKAINIKSVEANHIYMDSLAGVDKERKKVEFKIKDKLIEFKAITINDAVMNDSLFLRFMKSSIKITNRKSMDFIVMRFTYDVDCVVDGKIEKIDKFKNLTAFVGIFPVNAPQYTILVVLDEPKGTKETFGLRTAAWNAVPTAGKILDGILPLLFE